MHAALAKRVDELVECGWEPQTTTETSAALVGRRPFNWWLSKQLASTMAAFDPRFEILPGTRGPGTSQDLNDYEHGPYEIRGE